jgi:PAS domain S-box-containing protein
MSVQDTRPAGPPPEARLATLDVGALGTLRLDAIQEAALRASRLAVALFQATDADVVAVDGDRVWRAKAPDGEVGDAVARRLALIDEAPLWIADARLDARSSDHPAVRRADGVRFVAAAPIRLRSGVRVGALRVFDIHPRAYDAKLAQGLADLADVVADECERVLGSEARRVRELFEQAPGFMTIVRGPDHIYEMANEAYRDFMGPRELLGRPARDAAADLAAQGFLDICDQVYRAGEPYIGRDTKIMVQRAEGQPPTETYVDFVFQPLREADGSISGIFCQGHEVTRWKLAEDELKASREELAAALSATKAIFDHSHDVICTLDATGIYTKVSRHSAQVWGYRPDELVGRHFQMFIHGEDLPKSFAAADRIRGGQATSTFMNRYIHKDGGLVPVMWSSVWSEAHQTIFAIGRDMREHIEAEEKLRQAQKMEAVGRLTGGVAHDFNNLLTAVIGSAEALSDGLRDRPDLQPMADLVLEAAERGAELVSRLLAFSRRQPLASRPIESTAFLESLVGMLRRTIGEDIEIAVTPFAGELRCLADPTQLTSAMLNLCFNARDAMPNGGRLAIAAARQLERDGTAWVVLSVEDTGAGMAPETIERALEPFFTTKPAGRGSGLGLSMVYGFAEQSGGRLEIKSELGRGSRVKLYLPETCDAVTGAAGSTPTPAASGQHILVVEDDDLVRDQIGRQLAALGYRVTPASDGREALDRLAEMMDVDLVLTDVVMPGGMNGRQLADHAWLLNPGLRFLFTSGYAEDGIVQGGGLASDFLAKPYRRAELARKVAEALEHG